MPTNQAVAQLSRLIARSAPEEDVQKHIEKNPWILCGATILAPPIVISKLALGPDYICDFVFFWTYSGGHFVKLVEIESPKLEIFTQNDEFTSSFTHALQQLSDWEHWSCRHQDSLRILLEPLFDQGLISAIPAFTAVRTLLIAGRRAAVLANSRRRKRWERRVSEVPGREIRTWEGFLSSIPISYHEHSPQGHLIKCFRYAKQSYSRIAANLEESCGS